MLIPYNLKFKKHRRGFVKSKLKGVSLNFKYFKQYQGTFIFVAKNNGVVNAKQLEVIRRIVSRKTKKIAKIWFLVYPSISITAKPREVRMGSGKGDVKNWVAIVNAGKMVFALEKVSFALARNLLRLMNNKLEIALKIKKI